jgi:hypothetical protein
MNEYKSEDEKSQVGAIDDDEFSLSEDHVLSTANTSNESSKGGKKKRRFKPGKFISKLKIKRNDEKKRSDDEKVKEEREGEAKVSSPKLDSFRRTFVKRFSRRKKYQVSPMASTENTTLKDDEPLNNERKDLKEISKSDSNITNSLETVVHNTQELSKSMHTVDKSVYTRHEALSSSSLTKESKKVQLKITISGKKVEKVNASAIPEAGDDTASPPPSPPLPPQQQQAIRTDIILPSTSTTTRISTSSSDDIFNVMVPRNSGNNVNMHVLHQAKSISKPSVPYATVVKEGLVTTSSVSEKEIEKYLVLTSNLNSIISAAKNLDKINAEVGGRRNFEIPSDIQELKIYEDSSDIKQQQQQQEISIDIKSNIEKEKQLIESEMKKSRIPINKRRSSSSSQDIAEKDHPQTVHTQEAHRPYNLNLPTSTSAENLADKDSSELKAEDIKFELGTPVRPPKILQPSPNRPIADIVITEAQLSDDAKEHESTDDAYYSPKSESSITVTRRDPKTRRKIAYIPELSIYSPQEQELLKSNISVNNFESFDVPSLPLDSSIFPVFDESSVSSVETSMHLLPPRSYVHTQFQLNLCY